MINDFLDQVGFDWNKTVNWIVKNAYFFYFHRTISYTKILNMGTVQRFNIFYTRFRSELAFVSYRDSLNLKNTYR